MAFEDDFGVRIIERSTAEPEYDIDYTNKVVEITCTGDKTELVLLALDAGRSIVRNRVPGLIPFIGSTESDATETPPE